MGQKRGALPPPTHMVSSEEKTSALDLEELVVSRPRPQPRPTHLLRPSTPSPPALTFPKA